MNKNIIITILIIIVIAGGYYFLNQDSGEKRVISEKSTIRISGSGSGITILKPLAKAFEKENPNIIVRFLPSTATGDGVKGVGKGLLDVGSAARLMNTSERDEYPVTPTARASRP